MGGGEKGNTLYLLLWPNGASQHEGKTLQFPIPKSNRRSLKPSLSSAVSQITFANSISSKHTFHTKTVAKHNPGLHFHSNNLNPGDSYRRSPGADFFFSSLFYVHQRLSACARVFLFFSFSLLFFFPSTCVHMSIDAPNSSIPPRRLCAPLCTDYISSLSRSQVGHSDRSAVNKACPLEGECVFLCARGGEQWLSVFFGWICSYPMARSPPPRAGGNINP